MMAYLNKILIYSEILAKYRVHVHLVLPALQEARLYIKIKKWQIHIKEIVRLRLLISNKIFKKIEVV